MKKNILTIILVLLAIHLLYTNSILLLNFVEEKNFISDAFRVIFAASYSIITVLIIRVFPVRYVFFISGLLDGFSVAIKYIPIENNTTIILTALYFGLYTMFIVIVSGEITKKNEDKTKKNDVQTKTTDEILKQKRLNEIALLRNKKRALQNGINRMNNEKEKTIRQKKLDEITLKLLELNKPTI